MPTLWLAFIWGIGVSSGAAIGMIAYGLAREGLRRLLGDTEIYKSIRDFHDGSLKALENRNVLTVKAIAVLDRIAEALRDQEANAERAREVYLKQSHK